MFKQLLQILIPLLMCPAAYGYERIVSIGGTITEIVYGLGEGEAVLAVDVTSNYPEGVSQKRQLGYYSKISTEGVLALKPDLVLVGSSSLNSTLVSQLKQSGVNVKVIEEKESFEGIGSKIEQIAEILKKPDAGLKLKAKVEADLKKLRRQKKPKAVSAMFLYARGPHQLFVAGRDTPANIMLQEVGVKNAFSNVDGFKPISSESLISANPDYVLVQNTGARHIESAIWKMPGMDLTKAGKNKRLIKVDTLAFLGFGPRSGQELLKLTEAFNKDVSAR